jgi:hypothetical protein
VVWNTLQTANKLRFIISMCITLKYVHLDNDFDLHSLNDIGGVMVSVLASSAVDRRYESRSGQTKDVGICC